MLGLSWSAEVPVRRVSSRIAESSALLVMTVLKQSSVCWRVEGLSIHTLIDGELSQKISDFNQVRA